MLVIASKNPGKIKEIQEILKPFHFKIVGLEDIGFMEEIVEDGETLLENALIKIRAIEKFLDEKEIDASILSDDTGLFVDALNGEPGVYSARYGGEDGNDLLNRQKLLKELEGEENRQASFKTIMVLYFKGKEHVFTGECVGEISKEEKGQGGFGYDSIFYIPDKEMTMAEMGDVEKNKISHRKKALEEIAKFLERKE